MASCNRRVWLALAAIALLLTAAEFAYRPPSPLGVDAPLTVFSAGRAKAILQALVGEGVAHPVGSAADSRIRDSLVKQLTALGYTPELQSGVACDGDGVCGQVINVVAQLGEATQDDAVLLAAHYDSVPAGPGASDDGVGVATVLEIARILKASPKPRHPIVLLLDEGEEAGLLGASLFVREHPLSRRIKAAVNLDARGTSGPSLMFETGSANTWLMHLYGIAIAKPITNSVYYAVYKALPNDTDFTVFKAGGYQGFNFAFIGDVERYHTPQDTVANAALNTIQQQGANALASLTALANADSLDAPAGESSFFDVYSQALIAWPVQFAMPAALGCLLLLVLEAFWMRRQGVLSGGAMLRGGLGALLTLALGFALSAGLLASLILLDKVPSLAGPSWIAYPLPMQAACAAIALLAVGGVSTLMRTGYWGTWMAAALLDGALALGLSILAPGMSFVALLPAVAAAFAVLPCALGAARGRTPTKAMTDWAAWIPVFAAYALLIPLLWFLYTALGSVAWPISTVLLCVGALWLAPLIVGATSRARRAITSVAGAIALTGFLMALALPTYTAERPQRINIEYWLDADKAQAHWFVQPDSLRLPAALAAVEKFDPTPHPRYAGSSKLGFHAPAPLDLLEAPELVVTQPAAPAPEAGKSALRYDVRLRSNRGATEAFVIFPAAAQITEVLIPTRAAPLHAKLRRLRNGDSRLDAVGLSAAGLEFSLIAAGRPIPVQVFDESYDLKNGAAMKAARAPEATSSQDGDITLVRRTILLHPVADR